jgi:hypothetical protein
MEKMAKPRVMHFQWRGKIFGYTMCLCKYSSGATAPEPNADVEIW